MKNVRAGSLFFHTLLIVSVNFSLVGCGSSSSSDDSESSFSAGEVNALNTMMTEGANAGTDQNQSFSRGVTININHDGNCPISGTWELGGSFSATEVSFTGSLIQGFGTPSVPCVITSAGMSISGSLIYSISGTSSAFTMDISGTLIGSSGASCTVDAAWSYPGQTWSGTICGNAIALNEMLRKSGSADEWFYVLSSPARLFKMN